MLFKEIVDRRIDAHMDNIRWSEKLKMSTMYSGELRRVTRALLAVASACLVYHWSFCTPIGILLPTMQMPVTTIPPLLLLKIDKITSLILTAFAIQRERETSQKTLAYKNNQPMTGLIIKGFTVLPKLCAQVSVDPVSVARPSATYVSLSPIFHPIKGYNPVQVKNKQFMQFLSFRLCCV